MMDRALRFIDSWGLAWWVHEEHPASHTALLDGTFYALRCSTRLCFTTDMVTRCLEPCPSEWWTLPPEHLEDLCAQAVPHDHFGPPAHVPVMRVVSCPRRPVSDTMPGAEKGAA